jgi:hypothetical protein
MIKNIAGLKYREKNIAHKILRENIIMKISPEFSEIIKTTIKIKLQYSLNVLK